MASHAATGATLSLSSTATSVNPGATLSVSIDEDSGSDAINAVQASLNYDPAQLQFTSITEGSTFPLVAATSTNTPGVVRVGRGVQDAPVTGKHPIVTVNFKVLASSGSIDLSFDKNFSFIASSANSGDLLGTTNGATYTVAGTSTASATMSLLPGTANVTSGSTITVDVRENSGTGLVNSVQAAITYDAAKLQFLSVTEAGPFTNQAATDAGTAGRVRIARSVQIGGAGVTGDNSIVHLSFKVLATSGSAALNIDKTQSFVASSSTNEDILGVTAGSTYTVTTSGAPTGILQLSPTSGSYATDSTISVAVKADSNAPLTTVEAAISYPSNQLQYVSTTEGGVFTTAQRTNASTPGVVDIIRAIPGGNSGVTGTNPVVTINFKVIGTSGSIPLTFANASALYDDSGTGISILDKTASTTATYTIQSATSNCTANPNVPGNATKTNSTYTSITLSWAASAPGANCALAGYHVLRGGAVVGDVTAGTNFTDSGLNSGTNYSYSIQAFDTSGHVSAINTGVTLATKADDQSPSTPGSVTAAAPDAVSVNIGWNPSTDFPTPGGVGVAGYHIFRDGVANPTYAVTSGTTYTDTNVSPNTTYNYTVTAYDTLGNESAPSNVASAKTQNTVPTCNTNPTTPTSLTAGTSTLSTTDLSWAASTAGNGCMLAGYRVYRDSAFVGSTIVASFHDTGLTANTSYNYTVQAYDTSGHTSGLSTAKTIVTAADTTAPSAPLGVTAAAISSSRVTIAWAASTDDVGVKNYKIYRNGVLVTTVAGTANTYDDTTAIANSDYNYTVSAVDAAGNESGKTPAQPSPVHTPSAGDSTAPSIPDNLDTLVVSTTSVALTWGASTDNVGVIGYHVYRDGVYLGDATGLAFADTGLQADTLYTYTVKAFDAAGNTSVASAGLDVVTLRPILNLLGDCDGDGHVDLKDLSVLLSHWHNVNVPVRFGDIDQDGTVDIFDLSILLSHLGDAS